MSGRAGRRGKDDKGIVIQMLDEKMEPEVTKGMVYGLPDALYSSYHVSYNMVLNMLRVEDADPENLLKASFMQFQQEQQAPALEQKAVELLREADNVELIPTYDMSTLTSSAAVVAAATGTSSEDMYDSAEARTSTTTAAAAASSNSLSTSDLEAISEYYNWSKLLSAVHSELSALVRNPEACVPFLQPGRLVYISSPDTNNNSNNSRNNNTCWGWGCVISLIKPKTPLATLSKDTCIGIDPDVAVDNEHIVRVLVEVTKPTGGNVPNASDGQIAYSSQFEARKLSAKLGTPLASSGASELVVFHISLSCLVALSAIRLQLGNDLKSVPGREKVLKSMNEVKRRFPAPSAAAVDSVTASSNYYNTIVNSTLPLLDPVKDLGIDGSIYSTHVNRAIELSARMKGHVRFHSLIAQSNAARDLLVAAIEDANSSSKIDGGSGLGNKNKKRSPHKSARVLNLPSVAPPILTPDDVLARYAVKLELIESAKTIRANASESQSVTMKAELKKRMRILRRVGYISPAGVLETKGRFACELNTGDELVLTDMIFEGVFNALTVEQSVALLSCFVHREGGTKATEGKSLLSMVREDLQGAYRQLQTIARNVAKVSIDAKLVLDEEEYCNSFNPGMCDVLYGWSTGAKFIDICKLTDVFEGSIIRTIRREEELLRQLASACLAIGNDELKTKFEEGAEKIRRGVVFAASLYL